MGLKADQKKELKISLEITGYCVRTKQWDEKTEMFLCDKKMIIHGNKKEELNEIIRKETDNLVPKENIIINIEVLYEKQLDSDIGDFDVQEVEYEEGGLDKKYKKYGKSTSIIRYVVEDNEKKKILSFYVMLWVTRIHNDSMSMDASLVIFPIRSDQTTREYFNKNGNMLDGHQINPDFEVDNVKIHLKEPYKFNDEKEYLVDKENVIGKMFQKYIELLNLIKDMKIEV